MRCQPDPHVPFSGHGYPDGYGDPGPPPLPRKPSLLRKANAVRRRIVLAEYEAGRAAKRKAIQEKVYAMTPAERRQWGATASNVEILAML